MGTRNRSRTLRASSKGSWWYQRNIPNSFYASGAQNTIAITARDTSTDTTMFPPYNEDHTLLIDHKWVAPLYLDGRALWASPVSGGVSYMFDRYSILARTSYSNCPIPQVVNWQYWMTKALINLNPGTPVLDLPLFLFELKDMPDMIRQMGELLLKIRLEKRIRYSDYPDWFLGYSFGWNPLISDLKQMLGFVKATEDRIKYLQRLEKGSKVRRKLTPKGGYVAFDNVDKDGLKYFSTSYPSINGGWCYIADRHYKEILEVWYTANAKLQTTLPTGEDLTDMAYRLVTGQNLRVDTLWNAFPWTWLVDYMLNIGDFMQAQNGVVPFKVSRMNIMARQVSSDYAEGVRTPPDVEASTNSLTTIRLQRFKTNYPSAALTWSPFLGPQQVGNLLALVTRPFFQSEGRSPVRISRIVR